MMSKQFIIGLLVREQLLQTEVHQEIPQENTTARDMQRQRNGHQELAAVRKLERDY